MSRDPWASIGDPAELVETGLELHWAIQFVASAGQTFAVPRSDDSHRAMTWDATRRAFVGAPFAGAYPFRVAVRPEDLSLLLLDRTDDPLATLPLAGHTQDEAFGWLSVGVATYMGGAPPVLARPEYDIPAHDLGHGGRFTAETGGPLRAWADLYGGADAIIREVVATRDDASVVRCWPHHFDIASLITLESDESGSATRTVGLGLAPGGDPSEGWYLYVSPWPDPDPDQLPEISPPASWHTDGWVGAVLTGEALAGIAPENREDAVRTFFEEAIAASEAALKP